MTFEKSYKILKTGLKIYDNFLNSNDFLVFFYVNNKATFTIISFSDAHFKHLTGFESNLTANNFANMIRDDRLQSSNIKEKSNGTTKLKLSILQDIHLPLYSPSMIGEYHGFAKIYLKADSILGTTKSVALGLLKKDSVFFIPKSLLKEDIRQISHPTYPVVLVLKKNIEDSIYTEISYCKKGLCPHEFLVNNQEFFKNLNIHLVKDTLLQL